jgi:hypothetical protein
MTLTLSERSFAVREFLQRKHYLHHAVVVPAVLLDPDSQGSPATGLTRGHAMG